MQEEQAFLSCSASPQEEQRSKRFYCLHPKSVIILTLSAHVWSKNGRRRSRSTRRVKDAGPMEIRELLRGLVAFLAGVAVWAPAPAVAAQWLTDLNTARQQAYAENKPVLIYLFSRTVEPCRRMEQETFGEEAVKEKLGSLVCVALNVDRIADAVRTFKIMKVPTVVLLNPNGKELDRAVGYKPPGEFSQYLVRLLAADGNAGAFEGAAVDITVPREGTFPVTLRAHIPDARQVEAVGDFNDWVVRNPMIPQGNDQWAITLHLHRGIYEYKFLDNNGNYYLDEANPHRRINSGGYLNSALLVGEPKTSPLIEGNKVTFILYRPDAADIKIGGTFNDWKLITMYRNPRDEAMWGVSYTLPPGEYEYKFVIDEEWTPDPENYLPVIKGDNVNSSFVIAAP